MADPAQVPPSPLAQRLEETVLILDGALATELERRGADLADPLWSARCLIEAPELIHAVHLDYLRAGADIITTATYQATFEGFARRGLDRRAAAQLMRRAVDLARAARDEHASATRSARPAALIAASVGPYGAMLADGSEYRGHYGLSAAALAAFHRPRLEILAESGADVLACETLPSRREAEVLARLLEDLPLPAWVSFTCRDGGHDAEGEDIARCAASLEGSSRILAIGVNCTSPDHITGLLERLRTVTARALIAYPNSGEHYEAGGRGWSGRAHARSLASYAEEWCRAGVRIVGGCCRTGPADIAALRTALASRTRPAFPSA